MRVRDAHALAAAGLVDSLDPARARRPGELPQVLFAFDVESEAEEFRGPEMRDVDVAARIGAAHVERLRAALHTRQAEAGQELFGLVEARRLQAAEGEIGDFDDRHGLLLLLNSNWACLGLGTEAYPNSIGGSNRTCVDNHGFK